MSWGEAYRLALILAGDPSSQVGAAIADLAAPASRELLALHVLASNHLALHTEQRPRLRGLVDPLAKPVAPPRPLARLTAAEVDAVWLDMTMRES